MDEAEYLCDRIAIVDGGKIVAMDTPNGLKASIKDADRIELEVDADTEQMAAELRAEPYVHELTHDDRGAIIVATDYGARAIPKIIDHVEAGGAQAHLDQPSPPVPRGRVHPLHRPHVAR